MILYSFHTKAVIKKGLLSTAYDKYLFIMNELKSARFIAEYNVTIVHQQMGLAQL